MHFSTELDPSFFDQQVAETYNPRKNRWEVKKGKRNEVLDTHVYAIAASHHPELYLHKWKAADWKRRAAMLEPDVVEQEPPPPAVDAPKTEKSPFVPKTPRRSGGFVNGWK